MISQTSYEVIHQIQYQFKYLQARMLIYHTNKLITQLK